MITQITTIVAMTAETVPVMYVLLVMAVTGRAGVQFEDRVFRAFKYKQNIVAISSTFWSLLESTQCRGLIDFERSVNKGGFVVSYTK